MSQTDAVIDLLDAKSTVPFIARYRKEATGGLDDTQLRALEERLHYLRDLEERRAAIRKSIEDQGKLSPELAEAIAAAHTKARLEDLYLPYKPKRRTKSQIAREAGLEPLALALLRDPMLLPEAAAAAYVDTQKGVPDVAAALEGARWILIDTFAEDAELVGGLRQLLWDRGEWTLDRRGRQAGGGCEVLRLLQRQRTAETSPVAPRAGAVPRPRRGHTAPQGGAAARRRRGSVRLNPNGASRRAPASSIDAGPQTPGSPRTVRSTWKIKMLPQLEAEIERRLRDEAEAEAIRVFGRNLRDLLLAAPAGQRTTMGLDPGIRTGRQGGGRRQEPGSSWRPR